MKNEALNLFREMTPKAQALGWVGWEDHSQNVALVSEKIAKAAGLDADKAYVLGLLHDIGKSISTPDENMTHHLTGYDLLLEHHLPAAARVAITHTFYDGQEMDHFWDIISQNGLADKTQTLLAAFHPYDDYDKLIQLADNMATSSGVTTIAERFCDVLTRHLLPNPRKNLTALNSLKTYFDQKCGQSVYKLLQDDIEKTIF